MKFNHNRARRGMYVLSLLSILSWATFALVQAWRYVPFLAAWITLLIGVPVVAGFWPDKKPK